MANTLQEVDQKSLFADTVALIEAGFLVPSFDRMNWFIDTFFKTLGEKVLIAKGKAQQYIPRDALEMWLVGGYHLVKDEIKVTHYLETPFLPKVERVALLVGQPSVPIGVVTRGFLFQTDTQELVFKYNTEGVLTFTLFFLAEGDELAGDIIGCEVATAEEDADRIRNTLQKYRFEF